MSKNTAQANVNEEDRHALEALVVDNSDLARLEELSDEFNIFEAVGAIRQELRHSDFLSFLLDPQQNHGLGDVFAKRLLQQAIISAHDPSIPVSSIDLDIWSLNEIEVRREWQNIDILLLDENHRLAVIIENKIGSSERPGQLFRYYDKIVQQYPQWRIIALYLTPEGYTPSDERYLPIDYRLICEILEGLVQARASTLGPEIRTLITHYAQMLRRHIIVSESEIAELCRRIYRKHQKALDLIYEHRPDLQASIRQVLEPLIQQTSSLVLDSSSKAYVYFAPKEWQVAVLQAGEGWTKSGHILLFEFNSRSDSLTLRLYIGAGPRETRQKLFDMACAKRPPFKPASKTLKAKWNSIFSRSFLTSNAYEDAGIDELTKKIEEHWAKFVENDLPRIMAAIKAEKWIWERT